MSNKVDIYTCNGSTAQTWHTIWGGSSGQIELRNNLCITLYGDKTATGTKTSIYTCGKSNHQQWLQRSNGQLYNIGSGLCLTAPSSTNNTQLEIDTCKSPVPTNQQWHGGPTAPLPTVSLTAPASNSAVSGSSVSVAATASVTADSIASISLIANGSTLKTCTNTTTCGASWNTTKLKNGGYTIQAKAVASGGGSATTSESVTVKNATPAPTPSPSPSPTPTPSPSPTGSSSGSSPAAASPQATAQALGLTPQSNTTPGSSTGPSPYETTTPNTNSAQAASIRGSTQGSHSAAGVAIVITLALLGAAATLVIFVRRKPEQQPTVDPDFDAAHLPAFPLEDSAHADARLHWWLTDEERQQLAQSSAAEAPQQADSAIPDMYEEGRKRLEQEEEQQRHTPAANHDKHQESYDGPSLPKPQSPPKSTPDESKEQEIRLQ